MHDARRYATVRHSHAYHDTLALINCHLTMRLACVQKPYYFCLFGKRTKNTGSERVWLRQCIATTLDSNTKETWRENATDRQCAFVNYMVLCSVCADLWERRCLTMNQYTFTYIFFRSEDANDSSRRITHKLKTHLRDIFSIHFSIAPTKKKKTKYFFEMSKCRSSLWERFCLLVSVVSFAFRVNLNLLFSILNLTSTLPSPRSH